MVSSNAIVSIERPERYAKQLASHLGNKIEAVEIPTGWHLNFGIGIAVISWTESSLNLQASSETAEDLEKIQFVLDKHLRKFAAKLGELEINFI